MHHNVRRAGILSLAMLIACATAWHPVATETVAAGSARVYPRLLVVTTDGYRPELREATIRPDSIVGTGTDSLAGRRVAIAQERVARVESSDASAAPALAAVGGFIMDTGRLFYAMLGSLLACVFVLHS